MRATVILLASVLMVGCGDRIDKLVNDKFPPVSVDEQRTSAIASASDQFAKIVAPNVALSIAIKDLSSLASRPELKALGVEDLAIVGEETDISTRMDDAAMERIKLPSNRTIGHFP